MKCTVNTIIKSTSELPIGIFKQFSVNIHSFRNKRSDFNHSNHLHTSNHMFVLNFQILHSINRTLKVDFWEPQKLFNTKAKVIFSNSNRSSVDHNYIFNLSLYPINCLRRVICLVFWNIRNIYSLIVCDENPKQPNASTIFSTMVIVNYCSFICPPNQDEY